MPSPSSCVNRFQVNVISILNHLLIFLHTCILVHHTNVFFIHFILTDRLMGSHFKFCKFNFHFYKSSHLHIDIYFFGSIFTFCAYHRVLSISFYFYSIIIHHHSLEYQSLFLWFDIVFCDHYRLVSNRVLFTLDHWLLWHSYIDISPFKFGIFYCLLCPLSSVLDFNLIS